MLYNVTTEGPLKNRINSKKKSFAAWEIIQYQIFGKTINKWRMKTLRLPRIHGSLMQNSIPKERIPFSAMWSPSLLPKPTDWPEQCRVVGTFRFNQISEKKKAFDPIEAGFGDLENWLNSGPKPIFIGFGSMVIDNSEKLEEMIKIAAEKVQCRILVQSGWSKININGCLNAEDLSCDMGFRGPLCFNVGSCPHDWLLPRCSAVIHHGGAGTTAAGLEYGLPTFICPFFGDQYMWADAVYRASVGPRFCPVKDLDEDTLIKALKELRNPTIKMNAEKMAASMAKENGIQGGMNHFMDCLPVDNMFCDVSMLIGEVRRARYFLPGSNLKISVEVAALVEMAKDKLTFPIPQWLTEIGAFKMRRYAVTKYSISGGIHNIYDGFYYGTVGLVFQLGVQAPYKLFHLPDKYAFRCGAFGFCLGCLLGPFSMILKILYAILYFIDCVTLGIVNGCSGPKNQREYICNRFHKNNSFVYRHANVEIEREKIERDGIHEERFLVLLNAFEVAVEARRVFNLSNPKDDHMYKTTRVKIKDLCSNLENMAFQNNDHKVKIFDAMSVMGDQKLSFSQFCKILNAVVGDQIVAVTNESKVEGRERIDSKYWDVYSNSYFHDQDQKEQPFITREPVGRELKLIRIVGSAVKGIKSGQLKLGSESKERSVHFKAKTLPDSWGSQQIRSRASSFDGLPRSTPVRRTRGRTWSDGLANKIDEISQTVAGGRVRSRSPKARNWCTTQEALSMSKTRRTKQRNIDDFL
jgi:hypothetical protein